MFVFLGDREASVCVNLSVFVFYVFLFESKMMHLKGFIYLINVDY